MTTPKQLMEAAEVAADEEYDSARDGIIFKDGVEWLCNYFADMAQVQSREWPSPSQHCMELNAALLKARERADHFEYLYKEATGRIGE